jgi:hypothetical protein
VRFRHVTAAATAAVLLAACGADDDPDLGAAPDAENGVDEGDLEDLLGEGEDELDLPDPDEFITDGVFRGQGVVLPIPDGWSLDEFALMQGLVVATSDEDAGQQLAAQAVDASALEQEQIDFDELLDLQRNQFAEVDADLQPDLDEEIDVEGAERAHRLRFEDIAVPDPQGGEDQPPFTLDLVLAQDGDGTVALFNYAAPSDSYDESIADRMINEAGIDPDSEPPSPDPMAPGGEGAPVEPDEGAGDGAEGLDDEGDAPADE